MRISPNYVDLEDMPSAKKTYTTSIGTLMGGLNLRDLPYQMEADESPDMLNLMWRDGCLRSRDGQVYATNPVHGGGLGLASYVTSYADNLFYRDEKGIYRFPYKEDTEEAILIRTLSKPSGYVGTWSYRGTFFRYGDKLYYKEPGSFTEIYYNGTDWEVGEITPYVPTILMNADPATCGGDAYQPENRITGWKKVLYDPEETAKTIVVEADSETQSSILDYYVTKSPSVITFYAGRFPEDWTTLVVTVNNAVVASSAYTVDTTAGTITFTDTTILDDVPPTTYQLPITNIDDDSVPEYSIKWRDKSTGSGMVQLTSGFTVEAATSGVKVIFTGDNICASLSAYIAKYTFLSNGTAVTPTEVSTTTTINDTVFLPSADEDAITIYYGYKDRVVTTDYTVNTGNATLTFVSALNSEEVSSLILTYDERTLDSTEYSVASGNGSVTYKIGGGNTPTALAVQPGIEVYVRSVKQYLFRDYTVNALTGVVTFKSGHIPRAGQDVNPVEIAYRKDNDDAKEAIYSCRFAAVYGGTTGNCIVLAGCPAQPNAYFWNSNTSIDMDPGYWPIDTYQLAGANTEAITGFGVQQGYLIIFKEHSVGKSSMGTQTINERNYIDFPYENVNNRVGCNLPWSIKLIQNNMVWANTEGGVYYLSHTSSAYENNVIRLSEKLSSGNASTGILADLRFAGKDRVCAGDDGYRYWLNAEGRCYVWDYAISEYSDPSWFLFNEINGVDFIRVDNQFLELCVGGALAVFAKSLCDWYQVSRTQVMYYTSNTIQVDKSVGTRMKPIKVFLSYDDPEVWSAENFYYKGNTVRYNNVKYVCTISAGDSYRSTTTPNLDTAHWSTSTSSRGSFVEGTDFTYNESTMTITVTKSGVPNRERLIVTAVYGKSISKTYTFATQALGGYESLKDVVKVIFQMRSDAPGNIAVRYSDDYETRYDATPIETTGWSWAPRDLSYRDLAVRAYATIAVRRPGPKHVRHLTIQLTNDNALEDLGVVSVYIYYKYQGGDR